MLDKLIKKYISTSEHNVILNYYWYNVCICKISVLIIDVFMFASVEYYFIINVSMLISVKI